MPDRFLSGGGNTAHGRGHRGRREGDRTRRSGGETGASAAVLLTVEAAPQVLVVPLLGEAVVPQQVVGGVPEFGQRVGGAAVTPRQRSSF